MAKLKAEDLIFIDEAGINLAMARLYARAPRGERAYASQPVNYGDNVTMLGALSLHGMLAPMTVRGSADGELFRTYVQQVLAPVLRPGQVVLFDNLKAHKVAGVREAIEATGARVRLLPPYSPDYSPIEPGWSKVKNYLRGVAARSYRALERGVAAAMGTITAEDVRGWFEHCGYCTAAKCPPL